MIVPLFMIPFASKACFSVSRMWHDDPYGTPTIP